MGWQSATTAATRGLGRRRVLRLGLAAALALAPSVAAARTGEKKLTLRNVHTGERLHTVFWAQGRYVGESLADVSRVLRDHRTGEVHAIEPDLLDLLHRVQSTLDARGEFEVVSGYRSPSTNAALRRHGAQVAKQSLHTFGQAIDVRLPGRTLRDLRRAALAERAGGVGFYPRSAFVHLDVGPVRSW